MSVDEEKKTFVMKHVFPSSECKIGVTTYGKKEVHFGVPWRLFGGLMNMTYNVYLECMAPGNSDDWSIEIQTRLNVSNLPSNARMTFTFSPFLTHQHILMVMRNDAYDWPAEVIVTINKMNGNFGPKKENTFSKLSKKYSDVVLKVKDEKFHVLKQYLANHSTYFESLFFGNFEEAKQSEVELKDIDPEEFQNFLELIHGESLVDDNTVAGILHVADFFDSKIAIKRCHEFLLNRSEKSLKFKFHVATRYKLEELKKKCFGQMKTKNDVMSCASEDNDEFDKDVWKELFQKVTSFQ